MIFKESSKNSLSIQEKIQKWITFSAPIKRKWQDNIHKKNNDSVRLIASSQSSLANNLGRELQKDQCKNCKSDLEYMTFIKGALVFKYVDCKNHEKEFDKDLTQRFEDTYRSCDKDINKFCQMLWKGVYP